MIANNCLDEQDLTDVLVWLSENTGARETWFEFYAATSPILSASLDCAKSRKLNDIEALQVAVCMLEAKRSGVHPDVLKSLQGTK
jgi:hypothetical protein